MNNRTLCWHTNYPSTPCEKQHRGSSLKRQAYPEHDLTLICHPLAYRRCENQSANTGLTPGWHTHRWHHLYHLSWGARFDYIVFEPVLSFLPTFYLKRYHQRWYIHWVFAQGVVWHFPTHNGVGGDSPQDTDWFERDWTAHTDPQNELELIGVVSRYWQ